MSKKSVDCGLYRAGSSPRARGFRGRGGAALEFHEGRLGQGHVFHGEHAALLEHEVLHHPERHVAVALRRRELEHAAVRAPAGGAAPSSARGGAAGRRRGGRAPWRSGARRASGTRSAAARVARTRSTAAGPCRPPRGSACRRRRRRSSGTWARAKRVDAKGRRRAAGRREKGRGGGLSERRVAWTRRRGALLVEDLVAPSAEEHRGVVDGVRRARPRRSVLFGPAETRGAAESTTFPGS